MKRSHPLTVDRLEDRCVPSAGPLTTNVVPSGPTIPAGTSNVAAVAPAAPTVSTSPTTPATAGSSAVALTSPGDQTNVTGDVVSITVATGTNSPTVVYAATGLPDGLSVDPSSGIISGTLTGTGSTAVTVTATDSTTSAASNMTFNWTVNAATSSDGYLFVIDIPVNDPNAIPPMTITNTAPVNPWAIYGWDSIPLVPPVGGPILY